MKEPCRISSDQFQEMTGVPTVRHIIQVSCDLTPQRKSEVSMLMSIFSIRMGQLERKQAAFLLSFPSLRVVAVTNRILTKMANSWEYFSVCVVQPCTGSWELTYPRSNR